MNPGPSRSSSLREPATVGSHGEIHRESKALLTQ